MLRLISTILVGTVGGYLAFRLGIPLPWLIGSIASVACYQLLTGVANTPTWSRQIGQLILGAAIGLYFSPSAASDATAVAELIVAMAICSVGTAWLMAAALRKFTNLDPATSFFASMPGGVSEMAILSERFGGNAAIVTMFQSIRLMMVVFIIPAILFLNVDIVSHHRLETARSVNPFEMMALVVVSIVISSTFKRLKVPNSWFIGPLLVGIMLSFHGDGDLSVPNGTVEVGQILIGCALGTRFQRSSLRDMGTLLPKSLILTLTLILTLVSASMFASMFFPVPAVSIILGSAPGGIAEMGITAKSTGTDVALVTSFHLVRLVVILIFSAPIYRLTQRFL